MAEKERNCRCHLENENQGKVNEAKEELDQKELITELRATNHQYMAKVKDLQAKVEYYEYK